MKKRILPALLALCMVMSLLPTVFAAGDPEPTYQSCAREIPAADNGGEGTVVDGVVVKNVIDAPAVDAKCTVCKGASCGTAGCECVKVTVTVTETEAVAANGDNPAQAATKTTTTKYEYNTECAACKKSTTCNPCTGTSECKAETHTAKWGEDGKTKCAKACTAAGCMLNASHTGKHQGTACTKEQSKTGQCPADKHDASCGDKCELEGCTKTVDHTDKHDAGTACPASAEDKRCSAKTHGTGCTLMCETEGCAKTVNHTDKHEGTACSKDDRCPAASKNHAQPTYADAKMEKLAEGSDGCPKFVPCPLCVPEAVPAGQSEGETPEETPAAATYQIKAKGHDGEHNNTVCLGYNSDGKCGADHHITGCPNLCECAAEGGHLASAENKDDCTGEAGCPVCADLAECNCLACKASTTNPGLGVVTDNEGNEADPTEPAEPTVPDVPVKAEDFTDIDAEDESQEWLVEAVQTMLDNGWMQGVGGSKFDAGTEANTGMVLTVVARMYGEEGIEGANYAELAKAWADDNDLTEGIDLESDTIARKDIILLLWRLAGKSDSTQELEFTDIEGIEGDYLTALKWAVEKGIVMGNGDGTVTPDGVLTRGQLAALVARYANNVK